MKNGFKHTRFITKVSALYLKKTPRIFTYFENLSMQKINKVNKIYKVWPFHVPLWGRQWNNTVTIVCGPF